MEMQLNAQNVKFFITDILMVIHANAFLATQLIHPNQLSVKLVLTIVLIACQLLMQLLINMIFHVLLAQCLLTGIYFYSLTNILKETLYKN